MHKAQLGSARSAVSFENALLSVVMGRLWGTVQKTEHSGLTLQKARAYSAPLESIKRLSEPKRRANGEGNIRKRKDGRWEGRYTVSHDPETGKAIIKNVLGKTQAEVKEN